jgi:hypothetical protein
MDRGTSTKLLLLDRNCRDPARARPTFVRINQVESDPLRRHLVHFLINMTVAASRFANQNTPMPNMGSQGRRLGPSLAGFGFPVARGELVARSGLRYG